ncbi:MAG TPA: hypothetical protein VN873_16180 [Candidatus Angelobacter sp.]|nr:hypothetical protein [Candidatus Angelobacter sp.]
MLAETMQIAVELMAKGCSLKTSKPQKNMQIEMYILCDNFVMGKSPTGQMVWSIIQPFNAVDILRFPGTVTCTIVATVRFLAEEYGKHTIQISMFDADLRKIVDPTTNKPLECSKEFITPDKNKAHCQFQVWQIGKPGNVSGGTGALIEKPGDYFFELRVDGKTLGSLPLHLGLKK